jgi:hypothetical protein
VNSSSRFISPIDPRDRIQYFSENSSENNNNLKSCEVREVMVFNNTFNNISVISRRSFLLVEETGVPRKNHRPAASHLQTLSHNVV